MADCFPERVDYTEMANRGRVKVMMESDMNENRTPIKETAESETSAETVHKMVRFEVFGEEMLEKLVRLFTQTHERDPIYSYGDRVCCTSDAELQ